MAVLALSVLAWSLTYLVVAARVTRWPRTFVHALLPRWARGVLECGPCAATWVGMGLGAAGFVPAGLYAHAIQQSVLADIVVGGLWALATVGVYQAATGTVMAELGEHGG